MLVTPERPSPRGTVGGGYDMATVNPNRVDCACQYCGCAFTLPRCRLKLGMGHVCEACRKASPSDRFWRKVTKGDGCWLWSGSRHPNGHGYAYLDGRVTYAHRVAWMLTRGSIPDGINVCHKCDNPPCVNPDHLFLGTQADNMRDSAEKGRAAAGALKRSKLTPALVREVRTLLRAGWTQQKIADRLGTVTRSAIGLINQGRRWGHIRIED